MENPAAALSKSLGSHGKPLHTHEMHIRRGTKGGYIVKHDLVDGDGNLPTDGQRSTAEYPISSHPDLQAHVAEHMGDNAQEEMDADAGDK